MLVIELLAQVRDNLQDADADYWSDSELLHLHNECKRYISAERQEITSEKTVVLNDDTYEYTINGVLRYISAIDSNGTKRTLVSSDSEYADLQDSIIVKNYNLIYVNNPQYGVTLSLSVIAFPTDDNLPTVVRHGDENMYKYYILSKAYEKEQDMENFQKSIYFWNMFMSSLNTAKKNAKLNYIDDTQVTKGYYY
jgi:hypothetical protein